MADQVKVNDGALGDVAGGAADYKEHANGSFVNFGNYIIYTVAAGDFLGNIALRFGVTVNEIATVNGIKNPDLIYAGQKFTIYPRIVR